MANKLIIVESPAKVQTIQKFLGSSYEVAASQGHIRDLPKSTLGIDKENGFEPKYITIRGKGNVMNDLKKRIKKADKIYLATDPDREGEAISWHLQEALNMDGKEVLRISFNEITKDAVKNALKSPKQIDMNLVNAQQGRRVLDRVVGYELSPILWKKVRGKLSAGRVQSAVLRLVGDREEEIKSFRPKEFWTVSAVFPGFTAEYYGTDGKKRELTSESEVNSLRKDVEKSVFTVVSKKTVKRQKASPLPFTTSTLQQEASNDLNFSTQKTMRLAQELYEGVKIPGRGTVGLITYLRTDSTRVSKEADEACRKYVEETYGKQFVSEGVVKNSDNAQDAHEAIRPTDITLVPDEVKTALSRDLFRLYQLIWKRFTASRMQPAVYDQTSVSLKANDHVFTASSSELRFPGYLLVLSKKEDKESTVPGLGSIAEGDALTPSEIACQQHFTQPPLHFTEATLVRAMEELGLGRPSTYAPTITNILGKHYITKEGKNLFITELGEVVNTMMKSSFPDIVDLKFTAEMEKRLDEVAEGKLDYHVMMERFYPHFREELEKAEASIVRVKVEDEKSGEICDLCGREMVIKYGPHGRFLACPGFPECRNTKPFLEKTGIACPKCGKEILVKRTRKGRRYFGCSDAPNCDFMSWTKPKEPEKN